MMSCIEKKQNPNDLIHTFIIEGLNISRIFTLMFLIQVLICFYNRHPHLYLLKRSFAHGIYWKNNIYH